MSEWLSEVIGDDLIAVYEGLLLHRGRSCIGCGKSPAPSASCGAEEIDWLRWMAANIDDQDLLRKLSQDSDTDVRIWVACNPMTPKAGTREARGRSDRFCPQRSCPKQQYANASTSKTAR